MLLIVEALLLISAALRQDLRAAAEGQIYPLDMAPDSVDDLYYGCSREMEKLVDTVYLRKELEKSQDFRNAWRAGEQKFRETDYMDRKYLTALYVYTVDSVYGNFNKDVRNGKQKYKNQTFAWYSLHFLLTKALQFLKEKQNTFFLTVYRGTKSKFEGKNGLKFRFGSFTSFSLNRGVAQRFARIPGGSFQTGTCFEIKYYKGAEVTKYSQYPGEKEVLVPPYETFEVIAVRMNDWCNTVFVLRSVGGRSYLNCALFYTKTASKPLM